MRRVLQRGRVNSRQSWNRAAIACVVRGWGGNPWRVGASRWRLRCRNSISRFPLFSSARPSPCQAAPSLIVQELPIPRSRCRTSAAVPRGRLSRLTQPRSRARPSRRISLLLLHTSPLPFLTWPRVRLSRRMPTWARALPRGRISRRHMWRHILRLTPMFQRRISLRTSMVCRRISQTTRPPRTAPRRYNNGKAAQRIACATRSARPQVHPRGRQRLRRLSFTATTRSPRSVRDPAR